MQGAIFHVKRLAAESDKSMAHTTAAAAAAKAVALANLVKFKAQGPLTTVKPRLALTSSDNSSKAMAAIAAGQEMRAKTDTRARVSLDSPASAGSAPPLVTRTTPPPACRLAVTKTEPASQYL
jgi:hypothetical protein